MATTKRNAMLIEEARGKIRTTQLINRLQDHGLGKLKKPMDSTQVTATLGLLKKAVPDLQSVAHTGDHDGGPVQYEDMSDNALDAKRAMLEKQIKQSE